MSVKAECCHKFKTIKKKTLQFSFSGCNKNYEKEFDEKLKKEFASTYKFSKGDINKFGLILQKGVY